MVSRPPTLYLSYKADSKGLRNIPPFRLAPTFKSLQIKNKSILTSLQVEPCRLTAFSPTLKGSRCITYNLCKTNTGGYELLHRSRELDSLQDHKRRKTSEEVCSVKALCSRTKGLFPRDRSPLLVKTFQKMIYSNYVHTGFNLSVVIYQNKVTNEICKNTFHMRKGKLNRLG